MTKKTFKNQTCDSYTNLINQQTKTFADFNIIMIFQMIIHRDKKMNYFTDSPRIFEILHKKQSIKQKMIDSWIFSKHFTRIIKSADGIINIYYYLHIFILEIIDFTVSSYIFTVI